MSNILRLLTPRCSRQRFDYGDYSEKFIYGHFLPNQQNEVDNVCIHCFNGATTHRMASTVITRTVSLLPWHSLQFPLSLNTLHATCGTNYSITSITTQTFGIRCLSRFFNPDGLTGVSGHSVYTHHINDKT